MKKINEQFPELVKTYDPEVYDFTNLFLHYAEDDRGLPLEFYQLSQGYCFYFAYVFNRVMGGELHSYIFFELSVGHTFVKYKDKFFDGKYLKGVHDCRVILNPLGKGGTRLEHQSLDDFKVAWNLRADLCAHFEKTVAKILAHNRA